MGEPLRVMVLADDWKAKEEEIEGLRERVDELRQQVKHSEPQTEEEHISRATHLIEQGFTYLPDYALELLAEGEVEMVGVITGLAELAWEGRIKGREFLERFKEFKQFTDSSRLEDS